MAQRQDRAMTDRDMLLLALLDEDWRPYNIVPLRQDWRGAFGRLLDADGRWLALIQQRPVHACPKPRPDDIMLTRTLARRLRPLDMKLADHIIHAGETRFSFRSAGLL
ncbi:JAB domain-containing protein [Sphingobium sp. CR2-8]|uniref:JAB domain-containing protein n=1 Tax=Sphingobium sp. CR2-8 TaxID=1306534 RepID=UPI002DBBA5A5|nr:JAB domain-containing protein [Sphingobium sp. CR2-8]MEC3911373.1 JAB domain-containing protein [Sphingobium sp. CR2-8]